MDNALHVKNIPGLIPQEESVFLTPALTLKKLIKLVNVWIVLLIQEARQRIFIILQNVEQINAQVIKRSKKMALVVF